MSDWLLFGVFLLCQSALPLWLIGSTPARSNVWTRLTYLVAIANALALCALLAVIAVKWYGKLVTYTI